MDAMRFCDCVSVQLQDQPLYRPPTAKRVGSETLTPFQSYCRWSGHFPEVMCLEQGEGRQGRRGMMSSRKECSDHQRTWKVNSQAFPAGEPSKAG